MKLIERIKNKEVSVAVIGMGYVGLPLMLRIAESGFKVTGIDLDINKVNMINQGNSYIEYINDEDIKSLVTNNRLDVKNNYNILEEYDVIIICVPTPITINNKPDLSYVKQAIETITNHLRSNHLIVLESTTFPGTTDEIILPILSQTEFKVGKDFFLGFSPERVDPGNIKYEIKNTSKLVSGITEKCTNLIYTFYSQFIDDVYKTSNTKIAEMSKLLENTFRNVNIALVNQLSLFCNVVGIDVWEVIEAASTKSFGYMPFYPGPGIGGHCIPIDPLYLTWKANEYDFLFSLVEISNYINNNMPNIVINRLKDILNNFGKALSGAKIMLLGMSYKKNISDIRESPGLKIFKQLQKNGASVMYNDPFVDEIDIDNKKHISQNLNENILNDCDCTVILTSHSSYDYKWILKNSTAVFDTRNATKDIKQYREKIVKL